MRFIVANYGTRHLGMLLVHLHSIAKSNPSAKASVYWQDIPEQFIGAIRAAFPQFDFIQTEFDFAGDPIKRISSKVLCWARAAREHANEGKLVFADADTLVRSDLSVIFQDTEAGLFFTEKPAESTPLNSGVIYARGGAILTEFMELWCRKTVEILETPALYNQANDFSKPFGGTDQMSLYQMLGYEKGTTSYTVVLESGALKAKAIPCACYNETNSRPLADDIHVIHYKGGWQPILLQGRPFSRFRPRVASWDMFTLFLQTLHEALDLVNEKTGTRFTPRDVGVVWPWYFDNGRFSLPAYAAWRMREAFKRGGLMITGRLKN